MPSIRVTPAAESDLVAVWTYSAQAWGADRADTCLDQLEAGINRLRQYPALGIDYAHVRPGYRMLHVEHHCAFYTHRGDEVLIVRVLHETMDAPRHLGD